MHFRQVISALGACAVAICLSAPNASAEAFPTKPIQLVVPFAPGGGSDLSARIFAKYASKYLPQRVLVQNILGANGRTGELAVQNARPDGHMLLWSHQSMIIEYATNRADDPLAVYDPVATTASSPSALIIAKDSPYKTPLEMNKWAREKPGTIRWGIAVNGFSHFGELLYLDAAKIGVKDFRVINVNGDKDRLMAMMQGNMDVTIITLSAIVPYLKSGDVRLLGVLSSERSDAYPDLPTVKEQGVDMSFSYDYTTYAPKGTPADRIKMLAEAWKKAINDPECQKELKASLVLTKPLFGDEQDAFLKSEVKKFLRLATDFSLIEPKQK